MPLPRWLHALWGPGYLHVGELLKGLWTGLMMNSPTVPSRSLHIFDGARGGWWPSTQGSGISWGASASGGSSPDPMRFLPLLFVSLFENRPHYPTI
jgi:hypothetical protein